MPNQALEELKKEACSLDDDPDCVDMRGGIVEAVIDKAFRMGRQQGLEDALREVNACYPHGVTAVQDGLKNKALSAIQSLLNEKV